jgi:hypothetical protein
MAIEPLGVCHPVGVNESIIVIFYIMSSLRDFHGLSPHGKFKSLCESRRDDMIIDSVNQHNQNPDGET